MYAWGGFKPNPKTSGKVIGKRIAAGLQPGAKKPMNWYLTVWKRYAEFSGRSRRKEFWMFTLIQSLIMIAFFAAVAVSAMQSRRLALALDLLVILYSLAAIIPNLAVSVRRLHDHGKSGWWLLISLIPLGGLVILVFDCLDSDPADNEYGPCPKPAPATILG